MKVTIGIIALVFIFIPIIRMLYNRNWKVIYSTYSNEEYFRITAKLKSEGIKFKTETPQRNINNRIGRFMENTQYEIYVKKDEEHLAVKTLKKRS